MTKTENMSRAGNVQVVRRIEDYSGFVARERKGVWIFKLEQDYVYQSSLTGYHFLGDWLAIKPDGTITVRAGYAWNGCSPKWNLLDLLIIGTPDGVINIHTMRPKAYYASLVHDALYQYLGWHGIPRASADNLFLEILTRDRFMLRYVYYGAVRLFGGFFSPKDQAAPPVKFKA